MASVNPHLSFQDNCEEAFHLYRSVFGGEFRTIMRFKDMPAGTPIPEADRDKILHVALPLGNGTFLTGNDTMSGFGAPFTPGNNFTVAVATDSEEESNRIFDGLAAGGSVTMPLGRSFWGSLFGMLTDRFGIQWMVNFDLNEH